MAKARVEPKPANTPADAATVRKAAPAHTRTISSWPLRYTTVPFYLMMKWPF